MAKQRETAFVGSGEDLYAQIESARADMSARTQPPAEFTLTTDQLTKVKALLPAVGVNWTSAPFSADAGDLRCSGSDRRDRRGVDALPGATKEAGAAVASRTRVRLPWSSSRYLPPTANLWRPPQTPGPEAHVTLDERFAALRGHAKRRHQCDFAELEADVDQLQTEVAELLRRIPPQQPDTTPAHITVTAA